MKLGTGLIIKVRPFIPAYSYGFLILIISSLPTGGVDKVQSINKFLRIIFSDFSLHFFAFGILAVLLSYGFNKIKKYYLPLIKTGLYSLSYGMAIELYQAILSYRSFSLDDLFSDLVGIVFFLLVLRLFITFRKK